MSSTAPPDRPLLARLYAAPALVAPADIAQALVQAVAGESTPVATAALLAALAFGGADCDPGVLAACVDRLRTLALPLPAHQPAVDIVGTGGDGHSTFNVSTAAAIVAAGAGLRVCKHGNRASTSASGSADILAALGGSLSPSPAALEAMLAAPFAFLYAPACYPALADIAALRRQLPFPTIFNALGPLLNPANIRACVLGVHSQRLLRPFADALLRLGRDGLVVCGADGLDEISPAGPTHVCRVRNNTLSCFTLSPQAFGVAAHPLAAVAGGSPAHNAQTLAALLDGAEQGALLDFVLINAAALLVAAGRTDCWKTAAALARASICDGAARDALNAYVAASQSG